MTDRCYDTFFFTEPGPILNGSIEASDASSRTPNPYAPGPVSSLPRWAEQMDVQRFQPSGDHRRDKDKGKEKENGNEKERERERGGAMSDSLRRRIVPTEKRRGKRAPRRTVAAANAEDRPASKDTATTTVITISTTSAAKEAPPTKALHRGAADCANEGRERKADGGRAGAVLRKLAGLRLATGRAAR